MGQVIFPGRSRRGKSIGERTKTGSAISDEFISDSAIHLQKMSIRSPHRYGCYVINTRPMQEQRVRNRLVVVMMLLLSACSEAERLPELKLETQVTVSGLSSGAYMATQFHLAYNTHVTHAALLAGGPYECAQGALSTALTRCLDKRGLGIPLTELVEIARHRASMGMIDPLSTLQSDEVWIFHGTNDQRVLKEITDASVAFYRSLMPAQQVRYTSDIAVGHGFPTISHGVECGATGSPYLNACQWDGAYHILRHAYGDLNPPAETKALLSFAQKPFAENGQPTLADTGYVYVPQACRAGERCRLHIVFHGCKQNAEAIGDQFVTHAGFNRWAESNRIVVLYPQTTSSVLPVNPAACWDWWGYTGKHYASKQGAQIAQVANMVRALGVKW